MAQLGRPGLTDSQKTEMWQQWKRCHLVHRQLRLPFVQMIALDAKVARNLGSLSAPAFLQLHGFPLELGSKGLVLAHWTPPWGILSPFLCVCQFQAISDFPHRECTRIARRFL